jgi:hypothetical protein
MKMKSYLNPKTESNLRKNISNNWTTRNNGYWTGARKDDPARRVIRSAARALRAARIAE